MKKRIICILLCAAILFPFIATEASANSDPASGYFGDSQLLWQYNLYTKTLQISGSGPMPEMHPQGTPIPWEHLIKDVETVIIEEGVTTIGSWAFSSMARLTSVSIPNTVTKIGQQAFDYSDRLPEITLPASLTEIDSSAFWRCTGLKTVNCQEGLTVIGGFGDCSSLTTVNLPSSLKTIDEYAFSNCALEQLLIPNGVLSIGDMAFAGCTALTKIEIPATVTGIGANVFKDCTSLSEIQVDPANTLYSSDGGVLFNKDKTEFLGIPGMLSGNYTVPKSITAIPDYAFRNCAKLTGITIPDTVTTIGTEAFMGCSSLTTATVGASVSTIANSAFEGCTALQSIVIPAGVTKISDRAFYECAALKSVSLPDGLTEIGKEAFDLCASLTDVNIPATVASLGDYAFCRCASLPQLTLPEGLTKIGRGTFWNCDKLESITIPASVKTIVENPFFGCDSLQSIWVDGANPNFSSDSTGVLHNKKQNLLIAVPGGLAGSYSTLNTVTHININAFRDCDALTEVVFASSVTNISNGAFYDCDSLKAVKIPNSVTSVGSEVFEHCDRLERVEFAESVKQIGHSTFKDCASLTSVTLPSKLTTLSLSLFYNCTSLTSIEIPASVRTVDDSSFEGCTGLQEIVLPEGVWKIDHYAFRNCTSLTKVHLPASLQKTTHSSYRIFDGCTSLTDVYYGSNEAEWAKDINMDSNERLKTVNIHYTYSSACTGEHTVINDAGTVPSCTEGGLTAGSHCGVCGTVLEEQTVIPAKDHTFTEGTCSVCGAADPNGNGAENVIGVTRLAGADRYKTAFLAADQLKKQLGVSKFDAVVVASGTDFADALSGSYLAAVKNAPMLLVRNNKTTMQLVKDYIKANLASGGTVYLLGGVNAVPKAMESGLEGFKIQRLGGNTRYDTNLLILKEAGVGDKDILVCTGKGFADSLSASAAERPILLVKDSFTSAQKDFLTTAKGNLYIIGGTSAVSAKVETALKAYGTVKRLGGNTRYETSVLVAQEFFDKPTAAVLAYAQNFPDGLSGGALAAAIDAPLILTASGKDAAAAKYTMSLGIQNGYVLGGGTLINDKAVKNIFSVTAIK